MVTITPASRHRLTAEDFHKLVGSGVIGEDACIELIEGDLMDMAPIGSHHGGMVYLLNYLFTSAIGNSAVVGAQNPVVLGDYSESQPDLLVLKARKDYCRSSHPKPADVLLLVEVSDTTGQYDREIKIPLCARHGIPEVWWVDVTKNRLERCRAPSLSMGAISE